MKRQQLLLLIGVAALVAAQETTLPVATAEPEKNAGDIAWRVILAAALTLGAGLFSGLTLGLMSLESLELELLIKAGDARQAKYAKRIRPVRKAGNRLLCTLVLTNTAIYTLLPIVISDIAGGLVGFIVSTVLSVLFGEIIPQAICSRHGLAIGANTVWVVRGLMVILFPIAWPIAKMLDCLLGKEIAEAYSRKELTELILYHTSGKLEEGGGDLNTDETTIIRNALRFSLTPVNDVMTPLSKVFLLPKSGVLDELTMVRISKAGYSRVPIVASKRGEISGLLIVKTLFLLSPHVKIPISRVLDVTKHKCVYVEYGTSLDVMLNAFQWGKSHLAVVRKLRADCTDDEIAAHNKRVHKRNGSIKEKDLILLDKPPIKDADKKDSKKSKKRNSKQEEPVDDNEGESSGSDSESESESDDEGNKHGYKRVRVKRKTRRRKKIARIITDAEDDSSVVSSASSDSSIDEEILAAKKEKQIAAQKHLAKQELVKGEAAAELQRRLQSDQYITVGIVTLEDVVEELIGEEIFDETDFDEGSVAAATTGRDAVDQMMTMAYAAMKWKALAGIHEEGQASPVIPQRGNSSNSVRRRHQSFSAASRSSMDIDSGFKSEKIRVADLLKTQRTE